VQTTCAPRHASCIVADTDALTPSPLAQSASFFALSGVRPQTRSSRSIPIAWRAWTCERAWTPVPMIAAVLASSRASARVAIADVAAVRSSVMSRPSSSADGTPVFGAPREENAGFNKNIGVEFALDKLGSVGWSGFLHATYDNTLANYNSDFFPSVNNAALALGHVFHASYLAPLTGALNLTYQSRDGFHVSAEMPYESGYRYGVGTKTFVFAGNCVGGAPEVPVEVLNTDLAEACLGNSTLTSSYYYTDPSNPGTVLHPNITGSRGTPDGNDPGTLHGPPIMTMNLSIAKDLGYPNSGTQVGLRVANVFGNYTDAVVGGNSRYRNNGMGGYNSGVGFFGGTGNPSGSNLTFPNYEPFQYGRSPQPFENEPTGTARTWTFFMTTKL